MAEVMEQVDQKQRVELNPDFDAPVIAEYRPFSPLAVLGLFAALISWFALVSPLLWILPVMAALIGVMAVRHTSIGNRPPLGRKVAIAALVMAVFVLGFAPALYITGRMLICNQARDYGNAWIELVRQGNLEEAHQLHLTFFDRVAPGEDLKKHYEPRFPEAGVRMRQQIGVRDPYGDMTEFFALPPLRDMARSGKEGKYELVNVAIIPEESEGKFTIVDLHYRFTYPEGNTSKTIPLRVKMKRAVIDMGNKHWNVDSVENPAAPRSPLKAPG